MISEEMCSLAGRQKKYLRGLAHNLKPAVLVGRKGATVSLFQSIDTALMAHELIKIRFIEHKERTLKDPIVAEIINRTGSEIVGTVGHTAILYRPHPDPDKRKIVLPEKASDPR
jgi:RNA-binding protein